MQGPPFCNQLLFKHVAILLVYVFVCTFFSILIQLNEISIKLLNSGQHYHTRSQPFTCLRTEINLLSDKLPVLGKEKKELKAEFGL